MKYKTFFPKNILIDFKSNLKSALKKINKNGYGLVFITDQKKVVGTVSDGDIRRSILKKNKAIDLNKIYLKHIMNKKFFFLYDSVVSVKKIDKYSKIIPILNKKKELQGFIKNNLNKIPIYQPLIIGNEKKYINDAIDRNWISSSGKYVDLFEKKFKDFTGLKYVTTTTSGTSALHLAYLAIGIKPGDEVIMPAFTFGAPINALIQLNAKPIFVDVNYSTCCINEELIEKNISKKTKAIVLVHLYGNTCNIEKVSKIAKRFNLKVIEDCAEAIGTTYKKKHVGVFGDISTFSFFGNKTISTGEGGMVSCKNKNYLKKIKLYKNHGMNRDKNYFHVVPGLNFRMTNIQAAVGCAQMENIKNILKKKKMISDFYSSFFYKSKFFNIVKTSIHTFNTYWLFFLAIKEDINKDKLIFFLNKKGIDIRRSFYSVSEIPIYSKYINKKKYPISDILSKKGLCLPSYPDLDRNQLNRIVNLINFFCKR